MAGIPGWHQARLLAAAGALIAGLTVAAAGPSYASTPSAPNAAAVRQALQSVVLRSDHGSSSPSTTWSGYVDTDSTGNTYTHASGNWIEPTLKCTSTTAFVVFWVGLDGYTSSTHEEAGTVAYCNSGSAYYYEWWEMAPATRLKIGPEIKAGAHIASSVAANGTAYTFKVTDSSDTAKSLTAHHTCTTCVDSSAEWITEDPGDGNGSQVFPLADYGKWTLTGAKATSSGTSGTISAYPDVALRMVSGGTTLAGVGALSKSGGSFTTTWKAAS